MQSRKRQKAEKRQALMQAAKTCFLRKGVQKTTIDEIVTCAGVAKGTFYLYFADKDDLLGQLCVEMSKTVLLDAYERVKDEAYTDYIQMVLLFVDAIVEYFKSHTDELELLGKNFSWPLIRRELADGPQDDAFAQLTERLVHDPYRPDTTTEQRYLYLYAIIVLCGSVGYSSILLGQPAPIDVMKPVLYDIIRRTVQ